ncbi:MAG: hypothetical protein ACFCVK_07380 [Acidimicrobiales bacterium]
MATTTPERVTATKRRSSWFSLSTTPGLLRVESVALIVLAILSGLLAGFVVDQNLSDTDQIQSDAEPAIVSARSIQTTLAEANAAAASAFLAGGVEDPVQRQIYLDSLDEAAAEVAATAHLVGDDAEADTALRSMTASLARYAGLIESARANNRQGFPVGAAYLERAGDVLDQEIYPGTDLVANRAAERYRDTYDRQRGQALVLGAIAVALVLVLVAALLLVQLQLRRRFNRTLNIPLAVATVAAMVLTLWLVTALVNQTSRLGTARTEGYENTRLYLDVRGTGFGAKADEARFLIARGAGDAFEDRFQGRSAELNATAPELAAQAPDDASRSIATAVAEAWDGYATRHQAVVAAERSGERETAVALARTEAAEAFTTFDTASAEGLELAQTRFLDQMDAAGDALRGLRVGSLVTVVLVAALAAYGLQLRIGEYR